jgi:hypothetical protein
MARRRRRLAAAAAAVIDGVVLKDRIMRGDIEAIEEGVNSRAHAPSMPLPCPFGHSAHVFTARVAYLEVDSPPLFARRGQFRY